MEIDEKNRIPASPGKLQFSSFKDIRKTTVGETYRNLRILAEEKEIQKNKAFKELILSSSPLPLFDECLRLAAVDCLKLESEVVRILLSQNDCQIKRILNCKWFFKSLPSEFCASELFPYISASLRCKIITRLSKHLESEIEAEKYFAFVRRNYGNQRADYLLPKCSSRFILNHFDEHKPSFEYPAGVRILLNICKRYPEAGAHILSSLFDSKKAHFHHIYKRVLLYLAGNHCDLFVSFLRRHQSAIGNEVFGRKLTKRLGRKLRGTLFSGFSRVSVFKTVHLFSVLGFEERVKLMATIAGAERETLSFRTWSRSIYELRVLLKSVRPRDRLEMIEATFKQLYNSNFTDCSKCWCCGLLELLPLETRRPFVMKLEKYFAGEKTVFESNVDESFDIEDPENFVHLYDFGTAFGKFIELLRSAPQPSRRQKILNSMVKNCSINSDVKGLQEVVDFVASRHRNDDPSVIYSFIQNICHEFPWSALSSSTFDRLDDLIHFCTLKGNSDYHVRRQWKERHIYHLFESGRCEEALAKAENLFSGVIVENCYHGYSFVEDLKCRHSKALLLAVGDAAVRWIRKNPSEDSGATLLHCLIQTCESFSKVHPGSEILSEVPGLREMLNETLKTKFEDIGGEKWPFDVWERHYNYVQNAAFAPNCLLYVAKRRPELIETHLEGFLNCLLKNYAKTYKCFLNFFLRNVSFFEKTEKVKEVLSKEFKNGDSIRRREVALELYSHVSTIEEFTEIVKEFIPKQERVESGSDPAFGRIQLLTPRLIRNVRPRHRNFDLILKFFFGDFLKSAMASLQACCYHTRVDVVIPFLKERLNALPRRISYQKDIIRLIAELSTRDDVSAFCLSHWREHEHYSIRAILFPFLSKLFVEQPTRKSFEALEECILQADPTFIAKKPGLEDVPDDFLQDYVTALLRFSERQRPTFRSEFEQSVLLHFEGDKIKSLSTEFCEKIIRANLFRPGCSLDVGDFACAYLTADPNSTDGRVRLVLGLVNGEWKSFSNFLQVLFRRSRTDRAPFADVFGVILDNWPECPLGILFEDRVLLTYYHLHQKVLQTTTDSEQVAVKFAKELKKFYSGVDDVGDLVVIYAAALSNFFVNFQTSEAILAVRELATGQRDRNRAVAGILALPTEAVNLLRKEGETIGDAVAKSKMALNDLVKTLESYDDDVVKIYTRRKFFG